MGNGYAPNFGYMLRLDEETIKKLGLELSLLDLTLDDAYDAVTIELPSGTITAGIYLYSRELGDRYDDLEDGVYLFFEEKDILTGQRSQLGKELEDKCAFPEFKGWVVQG